MKKKVTGCVLLIFLLLLSTVVACGEKKQKTSDYYIYYLDKDKTKIVAEGFEPEASDTKGMIKEMLKALSKNTNSPDYQTAMPEEVKVNDWNLENAQLRLYFNNAYGEMDNVAEVLCRAAVVRTLTQIKGVDCISLYVGDSPLIDANGAPVGLMTAESFVENPGEQINAILSSEITLYFANKDGTKLVPEVQEVHYSSNISMEKLIMEHLLKGPENKELRSAVPQGTKLVSVSVLDGVCFVNLDEGFLDQNYEISEPIVIYSIVDSLVELPNINKVQIAVNGDSDKVYRDKYDLSVMYDRNLDYLDAGAETEAGQKEENAGGTGD